MSTAEQCRREAEICKRRALSAREKTMKAVLLSVARTWQTLADRMEQVPQH